MKLNIVYVLRCLELKVDSYVSVFQTYYDNFCLDLKIRFMCFGLSRIYRIVSVQNRKATSCVSEFQNSKHLREEVLFRIGRPVHTFRRSRIPNVDGNIFLIRIGSPIYMFQASKIEMSDENSFCMELKVRFICFGLPELK